MTAHFFSQEEPEEETAGLLASQRNATGRGRGKVAGFPVVVYIDSTLQGPLLKKPKRGPMLRTKAGPTTAKEKVWQYK